MMLEMISQCNWTRPVYVAITVGQENYMNLGDNFIQEGLANRITPFTTNAPGMKNFDTERVYTNLIGHASSSAVLTRRASISTKQ